MIHQQESTKLWFDTSLLFQYFSICPSWILSSNPSLNNTDAKFIFSRSLSDALELVSDMGNEIGIQKAELAFLNIQDVNNDERIRFIAGCHGLSALEKKVDDNPNSIAFSIFPSEISDVMRVADNNLTMPPKSTWFDPKPLDGLVVYEFN